MTTMPTLASLWLPILLSAVFVFIASSVIHMALPWHKSDFRKVPDQDRVMDALRPFSLPPGDYMLPRADSMDDMKSPDFQAKVERGPVWIFTALPNGRFAMGKSLTLWFVYLVVVTLIAAYIATLVVPIGGSRRLVARVISAACFLGFSAALWQSTIWFARSWVTTLKSTIDGLIYAFIVAATFVWLWPR